MRVVPATNIASLYNSLPGRKRKKYKKKKCSFCQGSDTGESAEIIPPYERQLNIARMHQQHLEKTQKSIDLLFNATRDLKQDKDVKVNARFVNYDSYISVYTRLVKALRQRSVKLTKLRRVGDRSQMMKIAPPIEHQWRITRREFESSISELLQNWSQGITASGYKPETCLHVLMDRLVENMSSSSQRKIFRPYHTTSSSFKISKKPKVQVSSRTRTLRHDLCKRVAASNSITTSAIFLQEPQVISDGITTEKDEDRAGDVQEEQVEAIISEPSEIELHEQSECTEMSKNEYWDSPGLVDDKAQMQQVRLQEAQISVDPTPATAPIPQMHEPSLVSSTTTNFSNNHDKNNSIDSKQSWASEQSSLQMDFDSISLDAKEGLGDSARSIIGDVESSQFNNSPTSLIRIKGTSISNPADFTSPASKAMKLGEECRQRTKPISHLLDLGGRCRSAVLCQRAGCQERNGRPSVSLATLRGSEIAGPTKAVSLLHVGDTVRVLNGDALPRASLKRRRSWCHKMSRLVKEAMSDKHNGAATTTRRDRLFPKGTRFILRRKSSSFCVLVRSTN